MTLINSNSTLQSVLTGIDVNAGFDKTYQPYLSDAQELYVLPVIGQEIITVLEGGSLDSEQTKALGYLQKALANYMVYEMADLSTVKVGAHGFQEAIGENQTQVRQWVLFNSKQKALHKADQFLDAALAYMEANKASFSEWTGSDSYTEFKTLLLPTTDVMHQYVSINKSRRTFQKLRPHLEAVEQSHISPALGKSLFDKIKADHLAGTLATPYAELLPMVQKAIAHLSMAEGAVSLPLNFEASGIKVVSTSDGIKAKAETHEKQLNTFITQQQTKGLEALAVLKQYLIDNTADFTEFTETEAENNKPELEPHDNFGKKSFMI
jgi:hypothetical protein